MVSDADMYAEAFEILSCMNKQEVMKIPIEILEFLKKEKSATYKTRIDKNDILNYKNIDQRTINFLNGLNMTYIVAEKEKERIVTLCKANDKKNEELKKEKFSLTIQNKTEENTTNKKDTEENTINKTDKEETSLSKIERKNNFFTRILEFFKRRKNAIRNM